MLNTGAILMVMLIYVRHRQISYICEKHNLQHLVKSKNLISSWFGGLGAFGITIVGNFQETNVFFVHIIGAFLSFGFGAVWQVLQTWISFKVFPYSGTTSQNKIRFFFSTICVFSFVTSSFCGLLGWFYFTGDDPTKWRKNDGGFAFHIISTISEWINAVIFAAFVLTFAPELKNVGFEEPRIRIWEKVVVESVVISQSTLSNGEEFDRY